MRVVEVHPAEESRASDLVEPRQRLVRDLVAGTVDAAERERLILAQVEIVEVCLKALRDAPLVIEDVGADETAGREPLRLQPFGKRRLLVVEEESAVVADAMRRRKRASKDRGVRRQRQR